MLKIWIQPDEEEVTRRDVLRVHSKYEDVYGVLAIKGVNSAAAHEPASCKSCGGICWSTDGGYQTQCDNCKKKIGF